MLITVSAQGFKLTPAIDASVRTRLHEALARFAPAVLSVDVHLRDINGPRGGVDKTALFSIRLREGPAMVVESSRSDVYAAIGVSARRAKRVVRRALGKSRRVARQALRDLRQGRAHSPVPVRAG